MKAHDLLKIYEEDSFIKTLLEEIKLKKNLYIKGLSGSLDAIIAAVNYKINPQHNIFILSDKEDAAYFYNDLQNLLGEENVYLFPMSYKKPYLYEEIDNANVLQRSEVLNQLNNEKTNLLIVTYPEALSEKVINRKSLIANTLQIKIGEKLDVSFISELLISYDFEKTDLTKVLFEFSGLEKLNLGLAVLNRTAFVNTRLSNVQFSGSIDRCSFEKCSFSKVTFHKVKLTQTFFKYNDLKRVKFIDCEADHLTYELLKHGKADLTGVKLMSA